jgi:uncharacterized protein YkwD
MKRPVILLALLCPAQVDAQVPDVRLDRGMLAVHNRERALVGVPALAWDQRLAADAAAYAARLASAGRFEHSPRASRPGVGENLAMGTQRSYSPVRLAETWVAEKRAFVNGVFPEVSRSGGWRTVGHYTAMIWRNTTSVGCGTATGGQNLYLVCRYAPAGNVVGRRAY